MEFLSHSLRDTIRFGKNVAGVLEKASLPCVVLLKGPLGSGKTTLIKTIISELADVSIEAISSPTFQYVSLYTSKTGVAIAHFDLWRLADAEAFLALGLDELLHSAISFVEWPERIEGLYSDDVIRIDIEPVSETKRCFRHTLGTV